jgi:hypothetical protein
MTRGQRTQIHVVVDVDVALFPSCEDLTSGCAHVVYRGGGIHRAAERRRVLAEIRRWKSSKVDRANIRVKTVCCLLCGETTCEIRRCSDRLSWSTAFSAPTAIRRLCIAPRGCTKRNGMNVYGFGRSF